MSLNDLKPLWDEYARILEASKRLKVFSYKASPHYLVPRFSKTSVRLWDVFGCFLIGESGSAKAVHPYDVRRTSDLLRAYIEVIHRYGGVFDISKPYADVLGQMGYTSRLRPWGARDFVFLTETMWKLPGKKHKEMRRMMNKLGRMGIECVSLSPADGEFVDSVEDEWAKDRHGRRGNIGYARKFLEHSLDLPECARFKALGFLFEGSPIAVAMGCMVTEDMWVLGYGYDARRDLRHMRHYAIKELAREFEGVPLVLSGDGGAPTSGVYQYKERLVCAEALPHNKTSYVVTQK